MKRLPFTLLAVGVAIVAALAIVTTASAHAPITHIEWAPDTNPTTLIASTNNREMVAEPGSFYVRVYNASGTRVDTGVYEMTPDRLQIHVRLQPDLAPGNYRVDWLTTSTDGAVLGGSASVPLPGSFGAAPEPATPEPAEEHEEGEEDVEEEMTGGSETIAPPSTGDGGLLGRDDAGFAMSSAVAAAVVMTLTAGGLAFAYRRW